MGSTSPSLNVPAGNQNTKSRISKSPLAAQAPTVAEDAHREVQWSPHHVRPDFRHPEASNLDGLAEARKEVANLKSRGVTRFVDMKRANKRNVEEIQSDEEELLDAGPPRQRPRLDPTLRPGNLDHDLDEDFDQKPGNDGIQPMPYTPTTLADSPMAIPAAEVEVDSMLPPPALLGFPEERIVVGPQLIRIDEPEPRGEPSAPPSVQHEVPSGLSASTLSSVAQQPSAPVAPPDTPERREVPTLDPALASLYERARRGEVWGQCVATSVWTSSKPSSRPRKGISIC